MTRIKFSPALSPAVGNQNRALAYASPTWEYAEYIAPKFKREQLPLVADVERNRRHYRRKPQQKTTA